jgi:hypothetical protein
MAKEYYLSDLFAVEPKGWGLRGDSYLWEAMKEYFCSTPLPRVADQLSAEISSAFKLLTGESIETQNYIFVEGAFPFCRYIDLAFSATAHRRCRTTMSAIDPKPT